MTQTEQQNIPALRFSGFEDTWKNRRLGELGTFKSGVGFPEAEQGGTSGIPFYKVSDMNLPGNEDVMTTANNYVTNEQISRLKLKPINAHAIIFAKVGAAIFLERKRQAKEFLLDNNMMAFIPDDDVAQEYLSYLFACLRLSRFAQVGALPSYNGSDLATIKLSLPSIHEQRKIAAFLGTVDTKIAQLVEKKRLLEDYKKGCMQQLFSQKIRFKDATGNYFPIWEEKRLGDIATFSKGKGISKADISEDGLTPCIRYGEIYTLYREHITDVQSATNVNPKGLFLSQRGDVIIPASGEDPLDMARACCVEDTGVALGGDINVLRGAPNGVFLAYYLNNAKRKEIASYAQGNSVVHLYASQMRNMNISFPHPKEQHKIADFLSALDRNIDLVGQELTHAQTFKKGLLQQMFV